MWKSSDSGMAEWGLNRLTSLQITTVNSEQNTNNNLLKVLESEQSAGRFWRRTETWNEASALDGFPAFEAFAWGQAAVKSGCRESKLTKTQAFWAETPKYRVLVSHSHRNLRDEISERRASEKGSSRFSV